MLAFIVQWNSTPRPQSSFLTLRLQHLSQTTLVKSSFLQQCLPSIQLLHFHKATSPWNICCMISKGLLWPLVGVLVSLREHWQSRIQCFGGHLEWVINQLTSTHSRLKWLTKCITKCWFWLVLCAQICYVIGDSRMHRCPIPTVQFQLQLG